jgi:hypothetical protein
MKNLLLLLMFIAVIGCGDSSPDKEQEPFTGPLPESMKGYEMYSWQENNVWKFTIITGTNRLKTHHEIIAKENKVENGFVKVTVSSFPGVKELLGRVPAEQFISWISNPNMVAGFSIPPANVVAEIQAHCDALNLHLTLVE